MQNKIISQKVPQARAKKGSLLTSTKPVYISTPALSESKIPLTIDGVVLSGLYEVLTPRPMAIPMGVVIP